MVKNLPGNAGDKGDLRSDPGWEDPLESMAAHSRVFLAGKSHGWRDLVSGVEVPQSQTRLSGPGHVCRGLKTPRFNDHPDFPVEKM